MVFGGFNKLGTILTRDYRVISHYDLFGKCHILQQIGDYDNFDKEIIRTVEYSQVNKNNWLWTENKKQEDGEKFMLEAIQSYFKEMYDTENDNLLPNMIEIGERTLK